MSTKRVGIIIAALLLAGALAVLLGRGRDDAPRAAGTSPSTAGPAQAGATGASPTAPAVPVPPPRPSQDSVAAPLRVVPATRTSEDASAKHGAFEGRIVSANSREGIAGAELTFASETGGAASVQTGADGRFRFLPGAPGTYQLAVVTAKGYLPFGPEWGQSPIRLTAAPGRRISDIVLALTPEVELVGKVESPDGQPVAGARIRLLTGRTGESVLFPTHDEGLTSDPAGEFRFHGPVGATVEARHPDYTSARTEVSPSMALARRVVLKLGKRGTEGQAPEAVGNEVLSGRVVDSSGGPVVGALVSVRSAARAYPKQFGDPNGYEALTDAEGRFTAEGLAPGTYDVTARQLGLAPARVTDVASGRKDLVLTLARGTKLEGTVRDAASGQPISSFSVGLMLKVGPLQREPFTQLSFIDSQGRYEVSGIAPGGYVVQLVAPGYTPAESQVEMVEGAGPLRVDFSLARGSRLTGRVVESGTNKPIENAHVIVESGGMGGGALSVRFDGVADATGEFTIDGLAPGNVSLFVEATGYNSRVISGVPVRPNTEAPVPQLLDLSKVQEGEEPKVEVVGIGAVLAAREDALVIGMTVPGGGAAEAGLAVGDAVVTIDGVPVVQLGFTEGIQRIRGPENSRVVLGIRRGVGGDAGTGPVVDIPVIRRRLQR